MAGRPRLYADAAQKARAYRKREDERYMKRDRITTEQLDLDLRRLRIAVSDAWRVNDPLAVSLKTTTVFDLLESLAAHFEERAASAATEASPVPRVTKRH